MLPPSTWIQTTTLFLSLVATAYCLFQTHKQRHSVDKLDTRQLRHNSRNSHRGHEGQYGPMQADEPVKTLSSRSSRRIKQDDQSKCDFPCSDHCGSDRVRCKAGVNVIKDGCDCCYMCARQQGENCNEKYKCDEEKGLYCDMHRKSTRICRARSARPCRVQISTDTFQTYNDGEIFKPDCSRQCSCQNGTYICTTLCPQEFRMPSTFYCKQPQLVSISGKCCKEWTCPLPLQRPSEPKSSESRECDKETTAWSSCSVTCGMGVSIRVTKKNADCTPVQQRRLCLVRPCEMRDDHMKEDCKSAWRPAEKSTITYKDCTSIKEFRPKYCSTCRKNKCCAPDKDKTIQLEFRCKDGRQPVENYMWIKSCDCAEHCP